ncbi:hypothetical protein [Actinacidiphila sp. ITFR-21]|uniref:hypothetical protein n=1 Tax=Actinacidiphila sp. ITFR-21 TaxID=3075199 RepID=UPI00288A1601|nr:hypothetical protein [Streptomyces sp. ITFR-21]WNI16643.1 hypothetical protein RLT57_14725 [Streptomyces sp. ITFR-21]
MPTVPSPGDLAHRPHRPLTARLVQTGAAVPPPPPLPPVQPERPVLDPGAPFLARYEAAIRFSGLSPSVRLVALVLALRANWATGVTGPAYRVGYGWLAAATGLAAVRVRENLHVLGQHGFLRRVPAERSDQPSVIELLIPPTPGPGARP